MKRGRGSYRGWRHPPGLYSLSRVLGLGVAATVVSLSSSQQLPVYTGSWSCSWSWRGDALSFLQLLELPRGSSLCRCCFRSADSPE